MLIGWLICVSTVVFPQIRFWLLSVMWFRSQTSEFFLFCQLDMRGDMFGMLSAHPLSPLLSLHHLDAIDPIFPNMNRTQALQHLFKAVNVDPARILQQTVCYDQSSQLTVSVAWGFAVQVYEGNQLLPDLLSLQRTFTSWRRGSNVESHFMFNLRDYPRDPCKRPTVFFLESVLSHNNSVQSNYVKHVVGNCARADVVRKIEKIRVFSEKLELDVEEVVMNWFNRLELDYISEVNVSKYSKVKCLVMPFSYSILFWQLAALQILNLCCRWNLPVASAVTFSPLIMNQWI